MIGSSLLRVLPTSPARALSSKMPTKSMAMAAAVPGSFVETRALAGAQYAAELDSAINAVKLASKLCNVRAGLAARSTHWCSIAHMGARRQWHSCKDLLQLGQHVMLVRAMMP